MSLKVVREVMEDHAVPELDHFQDNLDIQNLYRDLTKVVAMEKHLDQLYTLQSIVMEKVDNGKPLTPDAARILSISLESGFRQVNVKKKQVVIAVEQFTNKSDRLVATNIAAESLTETLKSAIKKLGAMLDELWERIKAFLKRIFGRSEMLEKSIKKAVELAEAIPDHIKPVADYITDNKAALEDASSSQFLEHNILFAINGKCNANTAKEIINNTTTLLDINRMIIIDMMATLRDISSKRPTEESIEKEAEELVNEIKNLMHKFTMTYRKNEGHQMVYSYGFFHDSTLFKLYEDVGKKHSEDEVRLFNIDLEMIKQKETDYKVEVLSKKEMAEVGVVTLKLIEKSKDFENVVSIVDKAVRETSSKLYHVFTTTDDKDMRSEVALALNLIQSIFHYVKKYLPKLSASANRVAADASTYVRSSVSYYKTA